MRPRVGVKAIVIHNGLMVAVKKVDADGAVYSFPGGGVEAGEQLAEYPFRPRALIPLLIQIAHGHAPSSPVYVGDIN